MRGQLCAAILALAACGRLGFDGTSRTPDGPPPADAAPPPDGFFGVGAWTATPPSPLSARVWTDAVWTGSRFLVFGGATDASYDATDTGALFDPTTQTWTPMSTTGDPGARHTTRMVVIGGQMIEYGGGSGLGAVAGGGRYDPATDTWSAMTATNAPGARIYASTVAIGDRMLTWGGLNGSHLQTGGIYDPATDTWTAMSTTGAPGARSFASAVWTGSEVIVWGGCDGGMPQCPNVHGDGAIYDPVTDTWRPMSSTNAPSPRYEHAAVWTGSAMIVFGGAADASEATALGDGGIYDPATDTWRAISTAGAPAPRIDASAAMLGTQMVIWGSDKGDYHGFLYDPATDSWTEIAWPGSPESRSRWAWAVSDHQLFVWGGGGVSSYLDDGAVWTAP